MNKVQMNKVQMQQVSQISRWLANPNKKYVNTFYSTRFKSWVQPNQKVALAAALAARHSLPKIESRSIARDQAVSMVKANIDWGMLFPIQYWELAERLIGKPDLLRDKSPGEILEKQAQKRKETLVVLSENH